MRIQAGDLFVNEDRELAHHTFINAYSGQIRFNHKCLLASLQDWRLLALENPHGYVVGAVAIQDQEAHIAILRSFRGKWKARQTMAAICTLFNIKKTWMTEQSDSRVFHFLTRNGWVFRGRDSRGLYFTRK